MGYCDVTADRRIDAAARRHRSGVVTGGPGALDQRRNPSVEACAAVDLRVVQVRGSVTPRWPWYLPPRSL